MGDLTFPVLDFPVLGADDSWAGPRWLGHLDGAGGRPLDGVWLVHGPHEEEFDGPGPWLKTGTVPRRRWLDDTDVTASTAMLTRLHVHDAPPGGVDAMQADAERHRDWERVGWLLDGSPLEARVAPGRDPEQRWAGFADTEAGWVVVVGQGVEPGEVRLVDVGDGAAYHADLRAPLSLPGSLDASLTQALGGRG